MTARLILAFALVLLAAASTSARRAHANDYVNAYYSRQKVMESCFGREYVRNQNAELSAAREACNAQKSREALDEPRSRTAFEIEHPDESLLDKPYFTEEMVRYLSKRAMAKTSNLTCVLRQLGHLDDRDELIYNNLISSIYSLSGVDSEFKNDLVDNINNCKAMARCLPLNEIAFPLTPALMRWSTFSKCVTGGVYQACIKKDLRQNADEFELSGFRSSLPYSSDSAKMYGVIWARTVLDQGSDFLW